MEFEKKIIQKKRKVIQIHLHLYNIAFKNNTKINVDYDIQDTKMYHEKYFMIYSVNNNKHITLIKYLNL